MAGERAPWLEGYRGKIVAGNGREASEHRLQERRGAEGRALPGKALVVYEPTGGLVSDVWPCEDGHAQERSMFGALVQTVESGDLWIADRNFCPREFLCAIDNRGAFFVTRAPQGWPFAILSPRGSCARTPTGQRAQQRVCVVDTQGHKHLFRRLRLKRNEATRDGATLLYILTNFPPQMSAQRVAELSRKRWTRETAFQHLEAYCHSEINTLGYPKAAWCGFCLALVASH
jgi:Transposase DDE domain